MKLHLIIFSVILVVVFPSCKKETVSDEVILSNIDWYYRNVVVMK